MKHIHVFRSKKGVLMLGFIAAALVAVGSGAGWHNITYNGQPLVVWGEKLPDGKIRWLPKEQPVYRPQQPDAEYKTNGVIAEKLTDGRKVRASDPDTLAQAVKEAESARPKCPGPNCPQPSKPDAPGLPFLKPKPLLPFGLTVADVVFSVAGAALGYMAFRATDRYFTPP